MAVTVAEAEDLCSFLGISNAMSGIRQMRTTTTEREGETHLARKRSEVAGSAWDQLTSSSAFVAWSVSQCSAGTAACQR